MIRHFAILIDGDNENTLGYACSRDILNISKKLIQDVSIDKKDIFTFFHNMQRDVYVKQLSKIGITNFYENSLDNIKKCFDYVVSMSQHEHVIIFLHYSGHGYQIRDNDGDEIDGCDEIFLGHTMKDDYIWENLITRLSKETHIFLSIDACHAGSGADLPYVWKNNEWKLSKNKNIIAQCSGYSISACNDSQCSQQDVGETTGFSGSLTAGLCDSCHFNELIHNPIKYFNELSKRLGKLNQTVELYSIQK